MVPLSDNVWSPIELVPWSQVVALHADGLRASLEYVERRSAFYQRKLKQAGVAASDLSSPEDLARYPFTFKAELRESFVDNPPLGSHLAADPRDVVQIQATSGTTGKPTYLPVTRQDIAAWNEMTARALYAGGVRPGHRVLSAFSQSRGLTGGLPMNRVLDYLGCTIVPIGAEAGSERLLGIMQDLRPDVWMGAPYFALYLAEQSPHVVQMEARTLGLRYLIVGGEPGGGIPSVRQRLEDEWQAVVTECLGASDIGLGIWNECLERGGMHFTAQGFVHPELIEPDSGAPLPLEAGVKGEIVYTSIGREAAPLLRFRIGDMLEVLSDPEACACGRTSPRIRCVGRTDDMLIVKGMNLWPSAIVDIVNDEEDLTGNLRVVMDNPDYVTHKPLQLRVEYDPDRLDESSLPARAEELAVLLRNRLLVRCEVQLVPPGTIEQPGPGKVKLVEVVQG